MWWNIFGSFFLVIILVIRIDMMLICRKWYRIKLIWCISFVVGILWRVLISWMVFCGEFQVRILILISIIVGVYNSFWLIICLVRFVSLYFCWWNILLFWRIFYFSWVFLWCGILVIIWILLWILISGEIFGFFIWLMCWVYRVRLV